MFTDAFLIEATLYILSTRQLLHGIIRYMKRRIPQQKRNILLPVYLVGALVVLVVGFMIYRGIRNETGNPILLSASDVPRISAADAIAAVRDQKAILLVPCQN